MIVSNYIDASAIVYSGTIFPPIIGRVLTFLGLPRGLFGGSGIIGKVLINYYSIDYWLADCWPLLRNRLRSLRVIRGYSGVTGGNGGVARALFRLAAFSYFLIRFLALSNWASLYYQSHSGPQPFQRIRYYVVMILSLLLGITRLLNIRFSSNDLLTLMSLSTYIESRYINGKWLYGSEPSAGASSNIIMLKIL